MSLILEALNRADKERSSEQGFASIQGQVFTNDNSHTNNHLYRITTIALIILTTAAVTYIFGNSSVNSEINAATPNNLITPNTNIITSEQHQPLVSTASIDQTASAHTPQPHLKQQSSKEVSNLYSQQQNSSQQIGKNIMSKSPIKSKQPKIASTESRIVESLPPFISDLPWKIQKQIPTIDYNQHVHFDADSSFIEINDKIIKNGQTIHSGLKLISIEKEYSILSYQQHKFRLPALNSWVNFN